MKNKDNYKIIILGAAGNGVRMMSQLLIQKINRKYPMANITYYFDYDSTVRGGKTTAFIAFDQKNKINEFIFSRCDLLLKFRNFNTKSVKTKETLGYTNSNKGFKIDFEKIALKNFKTQLYANTLALGYLSAKLRLNKSTEYLNDINKKAFKIGYSLFK